MGNLKDRYKINIILYDKNILSWLGGSFMKNYDYWNCFIKSGKIDDYLNYIACTREEIMEESDQLSSKEEGGFHAGVINKCDGNGTISHASW